MNDNIVRYTLSIHKQFHEKLKAFAERYGIRLAEAYRLNLHVGVHLLDMMENTDVEIYTDGELHSFIFSDMLPGFLEKNDD